jgi:hypothetical protein
MKNNVERDFHLLGDLHHGKRCVPQKVQKRERKILVDLFRLGISASALFRDLPGLAETLR